MKKEFSKEYILKNKGCYETEQVEALSFINQESIKIEDIIGSEMPLKDKCWFLVRKCELTNKEKAELTYELASVVLPIFEAKRPGDSRVKECLEAIQQFKLGKIDRDQLLIKRHAAAAAAVTAYSYAAYNAAYATADAAAVHAVHAAYAADAYAYAYNAADEADAYTDDAAYQSLIIQAMLQFVKNH